MKRSFVAWAFLISGVQPLGCGGGSAETSGAPEESGAAGAAPSLPPAPARGGEACVLSADCAAGTYCDLGECIQSCSSADPCADGLTCSPRGRCLPPDTEDADPAPLATHAGAVAVEADQTELGELDRSFEVKLTSTSTDPVRYRVETRAPFLRLDDEQRGEFTGSTKLRFSVAPEGLQGTLTRGSIEVHTELGDMAVKPSMRVGLTGRYEGVLRYTSGETPLGEVGLAVDLLDEGGDVLVRVDPKRSMTFPATDGEGAAGRGVFTFSEGLSVSIAQIFGPEYGGARNLFRRPVGRRVSLALKPAARGVLEGTFTEHVHGILEQPVELTGTVYLEPVDSKSSLDFDVPEPPTMPRVEPLAFHPISVFPGWRDETNCFEGCVGNRIDCMARDVLEFSGPLRNSMQSGYEVGQRWSELAERCETELALTSRDAFLAAPRSCALLPPVACKLEWIAKEDSWTTANLNRARVRYISTFARVLEPALLVAQNHLVDGLRESFTSGPTAQKQHFEAANEVLTPPATYLLAPGALQFLRSLPLEVAQGREDSPDASARNFPAGRALSRLLYVLHTLDGESARTDAARVTASADEKLARAQERGVLAFLEAVALAGVLEGWDNPPNLGNEFIGTLTLADRGFTALREGALVFGVPEGEVAFMYRDERGGSNFEQVLATTRDELQGFLTDQADFEAATREFEDREELLQKEMENVRFGIESEIALICGNSFQLGDAPASVNWAGCGADNTGEFGELTLEIEQATQQLRASEQRLNGMHQKLAIDQRRLEATQNIRQEQRDYIRYQGKQLESLTVQEGVINAVQVAIEIAAQANLWNAGAPLAMAPFAAGFEMLRTNINVTRQQLQTDMQDRLAEDEAKIEKEQGLAELQKQYIDILQLGVEIQQDALAVVQADQRRRNRLDRAMRLYEERLRTLARIANSPLQDPTYRLLQTRAALQAVRSRAHAQRWLYRAGRALEYEINLPLGEALPRAVLGAYNAKEAERLAGCLRSIYSGHLAEAGSPEEYVATVSVRRMLGITGPRLDEVTGKQLSAAELFRRALLRNENIDPDGNVTLTFTTSLEPSTGLSSANICDDKIYSVQAQLVGDFQGDNQAELLIGLDGGNFLRRCDSSEVINWNLDSALLKTIQAGVNTFGDAPPNQALFGQAVARSSWSITIPSASSTALNADLDLEHLDDIVLKIAHTALSRRTRPFSFDTSCLGSIGAGG